MSTTPTHITDYGTRTVQALPYPVQQPEAISDLADAIGASALQDLEDLAWDLYSELSILFASGDRLDKIGALFGVTREGQNDLYFRARVDLMARARWSHGTIGHLASIIWAAAKIETNLRYRVAQDAPCDCLYTLEAVSGSDTDLMTERYQAAIAEAIPEAAPAGTGVTVVDQTTTDHIVLDGSHPWSFVRLVQPVLDARCVSCHSGDGAGGELVIADEEGHIAEKLPRHRMLRAIEAGKMPPPKETAPLEPAEIEAIRHWARLPRDLAY